MAGEGGQNVYVCKKMDFPLSRYFLKYATTSKGK
jgi:hypothetical protein